MLIVRTIFGPILTRFGPILDGFWANFDANFDPILELIFRPILG